MEKNPEAVQVTGSFGVTAYDQNDDQRKMILRADRALYQAKNNGGNQVLFVER
jgi:GGDEF domain-containing protein